MQPSKPPGTELGTAAAWLTVPRVQPMAETASPAVVVLPQEEEEEEDELEDRTFGHTIATSSFSAASASQLSLLVGDSVEIIEQHESGWTYGRKVESGSAAPAVEGWFPTWAAK